MFSNSFLFKLVFSNVFLIMKNVFGYLRLLSAFLKSSVIFRAIEFFEKFRLLTHSRFSSASFFVLFQYF